MARSQSDPRDPIASCEDPAAASSKSQGRLAEKLNRLYQEALGGSNQPVKASIGYSATFHQLPLTPELTRCLPNHLARCNLFAPLRRGARILLKDQRLQGPAGLAIRFSGEQLDQADADVFLQVLELARSVPLGAPIQVKRGRFLMSIGRRVGYRDYLWLDQAFRRLTLATLSIRTRRYRAHLALIADWVHDQRTGEFTATLSPRIQALFSHREYALIDWEKRLQISRKVDLAKWLQGYVASHAKGEHRIGLALLHQWSGYGGRRRDFRRYLGEALSELERLTIVTSIALAQGRQGEEQVRWIRP